MKHIAHGRHSVIGNYRCISVIITSAPGKVITANGPTGVEKGKERRDVEMGPGGGEGSSDGS